MVAHTRYYEQLKGHDSEKDYTFYITILKPTSNNYMNKKRTRQRRMIILQLTPNTINIHSDRLFKLGWWRWWGGGGTVCNLSTCTLLFFSPVMQGFFLREHFITKHICSVDLHDYLFLYPFHFQVNCTVQPYIKFQPEFLLILFTLKHYAAYASAINILKELQLQLECQPLHGAVSQCFKSLSRHTK